MNTKIIVTISGMDCASCVINIDGMLEDTAGVIEARTDFKKERADVTFDPTKVTEQKIIGIIESSGYQATVVRSLG